jgi:hypothetical protein
MDGAMDSIDEVDDFSPPETEIPLDWVAPDEYGNANLQYAEDQARAEFVEKAIDYRYRVNDEELPEEYQTILDFLRFGVVTESVWRDGQKIGTRSYPVRDFPGVEDAIFRLGTRPLGNADELPTDPFEDGTIREVLWYFIPDQEVRTILGLD